MATVIVVWSYWTRTVGVTWWWDVTYVVRPPFTLPQLLDMWRLYKIWSP